MRSRGLVLLNVGITMLKFLHTPSSFPSPPLSLHLSCPVSHTSNHVKSFSLSLTLSFASRRINKKYENARKEEEGTAIAH